MPQLDAITPHPKQPKRTSRSSAKLGAPLPPEEATRRRKLMWGIVGLVTALILVLWFSTLGPRLRNVNGNDSAWATLKQKASEIFDTFGKRGDARIKNMNVNAPTEADLQYLREQVFPQSNSNAATNANTSVNQNTNAS